MSKRDPDLPLQHMLEYAKKAVTALENKTRDQLDEDEILNFALIRMLEVIGEAANRLPSEEQKKYPETPWRQIIGLRNHLIHGYDSVDTNIMWNIVKNDLPPLIRYLEKILNERPNE